MLRMVSIGSTTSCPETETRIPLETSRLAGSSIRKQLRFPGVEALAIVLYLDDHIGPARVGREIDAG